MSNLKHHLKSDVTTIASCWKLVLTSGKTLGFTDLDHDIVYDGVCYHSASGFTPSAVANNASLAVDNLEIEGALNSEYITEEDLLAGLYDHAEMWFFIINYQDLEQGNIILKRGWLGEVRIIDNKFITEVRGLTQKMNKTIGDIYSPTCRAIFCDNKCKLNKADYSFRGAITSVIDQKTIIDSKRGEENGYFNNGLINFISGLNKSISIEVKNYDNGIITLAMNLPFTINIGDEYEILAGCDKSINDCINRYNNIINFRGEPNIPGYDKLAKVEL
jgi:uncharacterized phage protein (TIGR02218 family)